MLIKADGVRTASGCASFLLKVPLGVLAADRLLKCFARDGLNDGLLPDKVRLRGDLNGVRSPDGVLIPTKRGVFLILESGWAKATFVLCGVFEMGDEGWFVIGEKGGRLR